MKQLRFVVNLCFLLLAGTGVAWAHDGKVAGIVLSEATRQPLPNATVSIEGTERTALTNALGRFTFSGLQEDSITLVVTHLGFAVTAQRALPSEGAVQTLTIVLPRTALQLRDVSVSGGLRTDVSRVNELDFSLRPVRTTQDLLRNVPGLFIAQHAGGGKAEQIFLRGFDCDHGTDVNVTVDGMPVNMVSHAHGQGYADLHWVIPETVESFRFGKGPYYADKGDFCTGGFVAFKTRDALEENLVKLEAGNYNTYRAVAMLRLPFRPDDRRQQSGYVAGEYAYSDGPFEHPQFFNRFNGIAKYTVFLNPNHQLQLTGTYFSSYWNASGQIPERAVESGLIGRFGSIDPTEGGQTGRINVNAVLTSQLKGGATWKNQLYYTHYRFNLYSNFTFFLNDSLNGDEINQHEQRHIIGYASTLTRETHLGSKELTMQYGVGLRADLIRDIYLSHVRAREFINDVKRGDIDQLNPYAYWNNTLQLSRRFTLTAALRYDQIRFAYENKLDTPARTSTAGAGRFSPKLGAYYQAAPNVRLYVNSGIGFHSNDARAAVDTSIGNKVREIMPAAYGADLGVNWKIGRSFLLNVALWTLKLDQEFVYSGDEAVVEPSGRTLRAGVDVSVRYQATRWLYADFDVNYAHGRSIDDPEGQNYIPLAPSLTSIGGLTAQLTKRLKLALRYRYMADRPANEDNSVTAHGYFVNDLAASYGWKRYNVGFNIENLFNVKWNEAQFDTDSRLPGEVSSISQLNFTPGTPFAFRVFGSVRF